MSKPVCKSVLKRCSRSASDICGFFSMVIACCTSPSTKAFGPVWAARTGAVQSSRAAATTRTERERRDVINISPPRIPVFGASRRAFCCEHRAVPLWPTRGRSAPAGVAFLALDALWCKTLSTVGFCPFSGVFWCDDDESQTAKRTARGGQPGGWRVAGGRSAGWRRPGAAARLVRILPAQNRRDGSEALADGETRRAAWTTLRFGHVRRRRFDPRTHARHRAAYPHRHGARAGGASDLRRRAAGRHRRGGAALLGFRHPSCRRLARRSTGGRRPLHALSGWLCLCGRSGRRPEAHRAVRD